MSGAFTYDQIAALKEILGAASKDEYLRGDLDYGALTDVDGVTRVGRRVDVLTVTRSIRVYKRGSCVVVKGRALRRRRTNADIPLWGGVGLAGIANHNPPVDP